jgi:hypothetical protein
MKIYVFPGSWAHEFCFTWVGFCTFREAFWKAKSFCRFGERVWGAVLLWRALVGHKVANGVEEGGRSQVGESVAWLGPALGAASQANMCQSLVRAEKTK